MLFLWLWFWGFFCYGIVTCEFFVLKFFSFNDRFKTSTKSNTLPINEKINKLCIINSENMITPISIKIY